PAVCHDTTMVGRNAEVLQQGQRRSFVQGRYFCQPRTPPLDCLGRRGRSLYVRPREVVATREQSAHTLKECRYPVEYGKSGVRPLNRPGITAAAGQRADERDRLPGRCLRGLHVAKIGRVEGSARTTIV